MDATKFHSISLEEFMRLYAEEGPFELIDGERIPVNPQALSSARRGFRLARLMADHVDAHNLGEVFSEAPFVLPDTDMTHWVKGSRTPDAMFVRAERLAALAAQNPVWDAGPLTIVPDLVVEVVSPTDKVDEVDEKVDRYLADGVRCVWLVKPKKRIVVMYTPGGEKILRADDVLSAETIMPGFAISIATLFE